MSVNSKMKALADEIRELSGTPTSKSIDTMTSDVNTANAEVAEQADLISQIATALEGKASGSGGVTLPTLSNPASTSDILSGKEAIDGSGNKITGTIATVTQATPSVSIDANGKITASATQSAGYVSAGTKSGTKQMTTQAAKTITPSTSSQTAVAKNVYTTGAVIVAAIPSNYEDVATETNAYTTKLASLETAVAALESELAGKASGGSPEGTYQIGTFTIDEYIVGFDDEVMVFPFIVGQTWGEWVNSPCNVTVANSLGSQKIYIDDDNYLKFINGGGVRATISVDGTESGYVSLEDLIVNMTNYKGYANDPTVDY